MANSKSNEIESFFVFSRLKLPQLFSDLQLYAVLVLIHDPQVCCMWHHVPEWISINCCQSDFASTQFTSQGTYWHYINLFHFVANIKSKHLKKGAFLGISSPPFLVTIIASFDHRYRSLVAVFQVPFDSPEYYHQRGRAPEQSFEVGGC